MTTTTPPAERFAISTDPKRLDLRVVHRFLTNSYWSAGISLTVVRKSIRGSFVFGVYCGRGQVGYARVITDFATYAYLADVFILENYRGQGLSKRLMERVMNHPRLRGLRRWGLVTRDAQGLYAQFGFQVVQSPERHMEILRRDVYASKAPTKSPTRSTRASRHQP